MKTVRSMKRKPSFQSCSEKQLMASRFVIAKAGKPLVKVVPSAKKGIVNADESAPRRKLGFMEAAFNASDDFDVMFQDEIQVMFYAEAAPKTSV